MNVYDPRSFGAAGDGVRSDTAAIQNALDACAAAGGGTVRFADGVFLTGTLKIGDNTTLEVRDGAELRGSLDLRAYADDIDGCIEFPPFDPCLIYAKGKRNLRFCGGGVINGQGDRSNFPHSLPGGGGKARRPMLIRLVECSGIEFENILLQDAASWCCHLVDCATIRIRHTRIDSCRNGNTDGFDLDSCRDVRIEDCILRTGDDAICLKSSRATPCSDFEIRRCTVSSETAAFKVLASVYPSNLTSTEMKALADANLNYFITVGNKNISMNGKVVGDEWADIIRFRDWLKNDMQVRVVNLFIVNPKIPYTDSGIGLVQNQMLASLKAGQDVGGIAEDEFDEDGNTIPGYQTSVPLAATISASDKASRRLTGCKFKARLAGAIHFAELTGSLTYEL